MGTSTIDINTPAPRYTSYPAVPFWVNEEVNSATWFSKVQDAARLTNREMSVYIHLLFCESLCTYCACNTRITTDHSVEKPYVQRLLKEWSMYVQALDDKPVLRDLHLGGGTPTFFSPENLDELLRGIISTAQVPSGNAFSFEAHPANTTPAHLEVLYRNGFRRMSLGVQDFNPHVMKLINRRQSAEQVKAVTNLARIIGYNSINYDLVYGLPGQTLASFTDTMNIVTQIRPDRIALYGYAHVPKLHPAQASFEKHLPAKTERTALCETGREMLLAAGYQEVGLDHFVLPGDELLNAASSGKLHRNFMGYTIHSSNLLVGIGPSAISDCGTMFVQNSPKAETWYGSIDGNQWAGYRGHVMSAEDMILRKHILNIMCNLETKWKDDVNDCMYLQRVSTLLQPFADAGLIELEEGKLRVNTAGKPYLRHICMCFDARLASNKASAPVLS